MNSVLQVLMVAAVFGAFCVLIHYLKTKRSGGSSGGEQQGNMEDLIPQMAAMAQMCVDLSKGMEANLDYSEASFAEVDKMIENHFEPGHTPMGTTVLTMGAYVGETMRQLLGGNWAVYQDQLILENIGGVDLKAFPMNKVHKRFTEGEGDSIAFFYEATKAMISRVGDGSE